MGSNLNFQLIAGQWLGSAPSRSLVRGQVVVGKLVPVRGQAPTPLFVASPWPDPIAGQWSDAIAAARPYRCEHGRPL
jgi:hypothetical protein